MPKGPNGEWRPAGDGPCAIHTMKVATGIIQETYEPPPKAKRPGAGVAGGKARAASMSAEQRSTLGKAAARARWGTT